MFPKELKAGYISSLFQEKTPFRIEVFVNHSVTINIENLREINTNPTVNICPALLIPICYGFQKAMVHSMHYSIG